MAAHQAVLMLVSITFGVCVGIGDATSVQTGRAVGAGDVADARRSGITGLILGSTVMAVAACIMWLCPDHLIGLLTSNTEVRQVASTLLAIAAIFQLMDGIQAVSAGALRAVGKTRAAFVANVGAHWCIGMPTAYVLAVVCNLGAAGLWWGLVAGLSVTAAILLTIFMRLEANAFRPLEDFTASQGSVKQAA